MKYKIEDCFLEIRNGANIKQGTIDGGFPITRIETLADDKFNRDRMGYAGITEVDKYHEYVLQDGDLLMSHINSPKYLGRTVVYHKQLGETIIHGMNLLKLKVNKNILFPDFVELLFSSFKFRSQVAKIMKKSVNQASFSVSDLKKIVIDVPPLDDQEEIVEKFNAIKRILHGRDTQLKMLDDLIKSQFIEMFGSVHDNKVYPYKAVQDLTSVVSGGTPSREKSEYWNDGYINWVKTTELQNNVIVDVEEKITDKGLAESSAKLVPRGTVLIAMYGQGKTRGMTAYLDVEASTNQACACILPSDNINQKFLWQYFMLSYDKLRGLAKGGNQPNLNGNMIKTFPVLLPPIEMQNDFIIFVQQVDKQKFIVQQSLEETKILFDALMQKYFG